MILHEAECVLYDNEDEVAVVLGELIANGFKMWHGGMIDDNVVMSSDAGIRWCYGHKFPDCIASLSNKMSRRLKECGMLKDANGDHPHTWISCDTFLARAQRCGNVEVGDLL